MEKAKIIRVLENVTDRLRINHDFENSQGDYPCNKNSEPCEICKEIAEATDLLFELKSEN